VQPVDIERTGVLAVTVPRVLFFQQRKKQNRKIDRPHPIGHCKQQYHHFHSTAIQPFQGYDNNNFKINKLPNFSASKSAERAQNAGPAKQTKTQKCGVHSQQKVDLRFACNGMAFHENRQQNGDNRHTGHHA